MRKSRNVNATAAFTLPVNLFLSLHFTLSLYHGAETSAEFSGVLSVPKGSAQRDSAFSRGKQQGGNFSWLLLRPAYAASWLFESDSIASKPGIAYCSAPPLLPSTHTSPKSHRLPTFAGSLLLRSRSAILGPSRSSCRYTWHVRRSGSLDSVSGRGLTSSSANRSGLIILIDLAAMSASRDDSTPDCALCERKATSMCGACKNASADQNSTACRLLATTTRPTARSASAKRLRGALHARISGSAARSVRRR